VGQREKLAGEGESGGEARLRREGERERDRRVCGRLMEGVWLRVSGAEENTIVPGNHRKICHPFQRGSWRKGVGMFGSGKGYNDLHAHRVLGKAHSHPMPNRCAAFALVRWRVRAREGQVSREKRNRLRRAISENAEKVERRRENKTTEAAQRGKGERERQGRAGKRVAASADRAATVGHPPPATTSFFTIRAFLADAVHPERLREIQQAISVLGWNEVVGTACDGSR
jgi:hypothetical protein